MGTSTRGKRDVRPVETEQEPPAEDELAEDTVDESAAEVADDDVADDVADDTVEDSAESTDDTDDTEDTDGDPDDATDDEERPSRLRRLLRPAVVVAVLAVLLVAGGAVWAWLKIQDLEQRAAAPEEARQAAVGFAKDLGTYDYRDMEGNFQLVTDRSTGNFSGQLRQITQAMSPLLTQTQATSKGTVPAAGVVTADESRAVVVVFLDQTIKNTNTAQPRVDRSRMQVTLVKQDGVWKLDHLEAR